MSLVWMIYFIDVLSSEGGLAVIGCLYFVVLLFFCFARVSVSSNSDVAEIKKILKIVNTGTLKTLAVVFILYGTLVPTKATAYKMLAAYGVTEIAQNESVQNLGGKSLEVLEKAMDDYLKESGK